jgi:hypothetical protein
MLILVVFSFPINAGHDAVGMVAQEDDNGGKVRVNNSEVQPPDDATLEPIHDDDILRHDNPSATTATAEGIDGTGVSIGGPTSTSMAGHTNVGFGEDPIGHLLEDNVGDHQQASQSSPQTLKMGLQNVMTVNTCMVGASVESEVSKCKNVLFWTSGHNSRILILVAFLFSIDAGHDAVDVGIRQDNNEGSGRRRGRGRKKGANPSNDDGNDKDKLPDNDNAGDGVEVRNTNTTNYIGDKEEEMMGTNLTNDTDKDHSTKSFKCKLLIF